MIPAAEEWHIVQMPAHDSTITTIDDLLALPEDGLRHELLDGEHVGTPSPALPHQMVLQELFLVLGNTLANREDLTVFLSPADVVLAPNTLVQPDLFVISKEAGRRLTAWSEIGIPILAVEILSPSTASRDRGKKRRIYQMAGIAEYWIVDSDARIVERWMPNDERPEIVDESLVWVASRDLRVPLDVAALFERALGPL